jgi:hypothetical protein
MAVGLPTNNRLRDVCVSSLSADVVRGKLSNSELLNTASCTVNVGSQDR